ncbi:hypothetical protein BTVI_53889 [Pitangus sulphuratus]|nr:hypothetical protein BTVI_53889 [Pitangus sulphuratus]
MKVSHRKMNHLSTHRTEYDFFPATEQNELPVSGIENLDLKIGTNSLIMFQEEPKNMIYCAARFACSRKCLATVKNKVSVLFLGQVTRKYEVQMMPEGKEELAIVDMVATVEMPTHIMCKLKRTQRYLPSSTCLATIIYALMIFHNINKFVAPQIK